MIKKGISGGMLSAFSLLNSADRQALTDHLTVRTSSRISEAAKIGLQSLYANSEEVLNKFENFDIVKAMKSREGANLLWVRARAIDANVINSNGDYFSDEELTAEGDYQGKKMPAYKTFEGVPIYSNHENKDIDKARGMVVYAEWDDDEQCVYCVFFIDEDAYPEVAQGIRHGYIHDVSMGCAVEYGICSICDNKATTEKEYCECLKKYKGKMHPSGKKAFEYNYGIKFIELSCVGDGAFEACEILELYDQEEILNKSQETVKTAVALNKSIVLAAGYHNGEKEVESALRQLEHLNRLIIKVAQSAGTLVGGQLLGGGAGAQNATVVKVLQGLGIDPSSSLNILDLVNLALNFLEVAVLNLFSRKDNIDLSHVAKLTKAMGELQNTLQDMIDDGIETGNTTNNQPMMPPASGVQQGQPQMQQPQMPPAGAQAQQQTNTMFEPSVGSMISPFSTQQEYVMPLGGGVGASVSDNVRFVWASTQDEVSVKKAEKNHFARLVMALAQLQEFCGVDKPQQNKEVLELPQKIKTTSSGDKYIMEHFKKIANDFKKNKEIALSVDISLDDTNGNKVVLSTNGGIKGYYKGALTNWKPDLGDNQLRMMESGQGYEVARDLMVSFGNLIKKAEEEKNVEHLIVLDEQVDQERKSKPEANNVEILNLHKGVMGDNEKNYNEVLENRRTHDKNLTQWEIMLEGQNENETVSIIHQLWDHARTAVGDEVLEEQLAPTRGASNVSGHRIINAVINGVASACRKSNAKPKDILEFLTANANNDDFAKVLKLARLGTPTRTAKLAMKKMSQMAPPTPQAPMAPMSPEATPEQPGGQNLDSITEIADSATPEMTEGDIMKALGVIRDSFEMAVNKLNEVLGESEEDMDPQKEDMESALGGEDDVDQDSMKGAVSGLSLAGDETGASPQELISQVNSMPINTMASKIDKIRKSGSSTRTASKKDLSTNIVGWLAEVADHYKLDTEKLALATKLFCSYEKAAEDVLLRSKTAAVKVVDETSHTTTIYATLDDIGVDVKDAMFSQKLREFAVDLLSNSGYEVDPGTFALTDIDVHEDGTVTAKVSSRASKTFAPDIAKEEYIDHDLDAIAAEPEMPEMGMGGPSVGEELSPEMGAPEEGAVVMSANAKAIKRLARISNVIKIAQGMGLPGAGAPAGGGGAMGGGPMMGGGDMSGGTPPMDAGPGVGAFTSGEADPFGGEGVNESPEPGNKSPWGTICPQCGSKDIDIANGEGKCNSCDAQLKYKFMVEATPPDTKGLGAPEGEEPMAEAPPVGGPVAGAEGGMPPATAPTGAGMGAPAGGMTPGAPAMASQYNVMTRVAYVTTADVYANALSNNFKKEAAHKLPVGMICPACSSRTASKKNNRTYCYDCGTISISSVKRIEGQPGKLAVDIVWL